MAMIRCEKCNELISDKSTNCVHCGYPVKSNHRICKECGNIIGEDEKTCHFCGCPVKKDWFGSKRNKLIILLVLVLFVGAAVGIGKYTENKRIEAQKIAAYIN
jgi:RNA polymerase subunit RPABC4/transcription elongation factor Spt4